MTRHLTRILISSCVTVVLAIGASGADPQQGPSFPRIANVYGTALTAQGAQFHGDERSLADVAKYDLLVGVQRPHTKGGELFSKQLNELKRINPHLIALHFACSAPYTHITPSADLLASRQPGQLLPWLLQIDGTPIAGWPGTYMLNLAAPGVIEWLAQQTVPAVKEVGYHGVFIDCMGPHFDSWACEIATGKPYTVDFDADGEDDDPGQLKEIWTDSKTKLARRVRELLGPTAIFMANQAGPDTYDQLNGIYLEDYIDAVLDRGMSWEKVLEQYLHWTKTPRRPNVTVLGCSSGVEPPFEVFKLAPEERARILARGKPQLNRMRFGLATTLMGDGCYSFDLHTRWRGQYWWYPEFDTPLGYPKDSCERHRDGTWRRQFDNGLVVVNPSKWDVAIKLQQQYRDVSSGQVDRQFLIPRQDGRIYLPTDELARQGTMPPVEPCFSPDGAAGMIQRDGNLVLRDGQGLAVLIDNSGAIQSLVWDGQELLERVDSVIVTDGRWRNFATENLRHHLEPDGTLTLAGERTFEEQTVDFSQTLALANGCLRVDYRWSAKTPLQLKAFRPTIRFSPRLFGGTQLVADAEKILLPTEMTQDPNLAKNITSAVLTIPGDRTMTISLPQTSHLVDDRHYNGSGYLLAFYPVAGTIPAGREWSYAIEIRCNKRATAAPSSAPGS